MKYLQFSVICLLIFTSFNSFSQSVILPGTQSNRVDENGNPTNTYYGAPSGAMTYWDSSPYQDFYLEDKMNFRLLLPNGYDENSDKEYPMILMMHGAGESGVSWLGKRTYEPTEPEYLNNDHQLSHGGRQHLEAVNRDPSDPRAFPGFVLFPQNASGWYQFEVDHAIEIVELLIKKYNIDQNRIYVHGLSNGAVGVWNIIEKRPDLFAATLPMSGVPGDNYDYSRMVHIPLWLFQGGQDDNPYPRTTEDRLDRLRQAGGTPKYTLYPEQGHSVWNTAYAAPDFFSWMLQNSKLTIHVAHGTTEFCEGEPVSANLGISPGFSAYEWAKDGAVISDATTNELTVTHYGSYTVRFKRDTEWTEWSSPVIISEKALTVTPEITTSGSTALPTPDGNESVILYAPEGNESYLWSTGETTDSITVSTPGSYTVKVTEPGGCQSLASEPVIVTVNGITDITAPSNLTASALSETEIALDWQDNTDNETGFEIYRAISSDGTYEIVATTEASIVKLTDKGLTPETSYFYKIRGVNSNGGSEFTSVVSASTFPDEEAPSTPSGLASTSVTVSSISISWNASSDNVGVEKYNIYNGADLTGSAVDTTFTLSDLAPENVYRITVKAVDAAGNISQASNKLSEVTIVQGLKYKYYLGGTWDKIAGYKDWPVSKSGTIENFNISTVSNDGVRPDVDEDYFAFDFEGHIYIDQEGAYTFYTDSDDGSKLFIDETAVVDNDSLHTVQEKSGEINLSEGAHTIKVQYFDRTEAESLNVYYSGPGISKQIIPDSVLKSSDLLDSLSIILDVNTPEIINARVKVFPNPVKDVLHISFEKGNYAEVTLSLIDQIGKVHLTTTHHLFQGDSALDINLWEKDLKPGMYFLQLIYSDGKSEHIRFLKE